MNTSPVSAVSDIKKLLLGVVMPVGLFVVYHFLLIVIVGGKGEGWGMACLPLMFASFIVIPAIFTVNILVVMIPRWRTPNLVILAGFVLPVVAAWVEHRYLYSH
jgi:hypothetical protein